MEKKSSAYVFELAKERTAYAAAISLLNKN